MFGLGWHTCRRPGALYIDANNWRFNHSRHPNGLSHQRKPASAGCTHGAAASVGCANHHVHHADLIFDICDSVTVLNLGRVLAAGTPAEIRVHKEVVSAYLGG